MSYRPSLFCLLICLDAVLMEMLDTAKHRDIEGLGDADEQLSNEVPKQQQQQQLCKWQ